MTDKPTYEELEQRVKAFEKEVLQHKQPPDSILKEEQDKYNKLIQDSNDAIVIVQGAELKLANKAAYRMWGYQHEEEMADLKMTDMVSPKSLEMLLKRAEARKRGENVPSRYEFRARCKDGTEFLAEVSVSRIVYHGQVARQAVIRDITEQKLAEKKYKLLADHVTDAICVVNIDELKFEYVSPSVKKVFGYTVEEFVNLDIYDLLLPYSADVVMETITQELEKNKHGKAEPQLLELEIIRKDGLKICVGVSARFLRDNEEHVTSILCVARDISERKKAGESLKESEEKYQKMFHLSPSALVITSLEDGNIIYINNSLSRITGYSEGEVLGRTSIEAGFWIKPEDRETVTQKLRGAGGFRNLEFEYRNRQGEIRLGRFSAEIISIQKHQYILTAIEDITEKKRLEDELHQANIELEERVKERTTEIEEKNIALKVLLNQRGGDKKNLEAAIMSNVKELLIPNIKRLKNSSLTSKQQTSVNVLESNLNEITSPFVNSVSSTFMKLTPTEIQVANFIKHGMSSKDIAESLSLSQRTVDTHRYNIRKKLGIRVKGINLRTYLLSLT